jgi:hypothetical protein
MAALVDKCAELPIVSYNITYHRIVDKVGEYSATPKNITHVAGRWAFFVFGIILYTRLNCGDILCFDSFCFVLSKARGDYHQ